MNSAVAYYRVSTQRQGRSGLGIEAQKAAVAHFAGAERITILHEFTEVETGKGVDALNRRLSWQPPSAWRDSTNVLSSSLNSIASPATSPSSPG